jgi:hypothetical protein
MAKKQAVTLEIGDHVRLLTRAANHHSSAVAGGVTPATIREPVDGLVLAIRAVKTGQLMTKTADSMDSYVIEMLVDNTFNPRMASTRNVARTVERPTAAPNWKRIRTNLRDAAANGQLFSVAHENFLAEGPFGKLLDGWKVVKVWSSDVVSLEEAAE